MCLLLLEAGKKLNSIANSTIRCMDYGVQFKRKEQEVVVVRQAQQEGGKANLKVTSDYREVCKMSDSVNNPKHYTSHPSGVECIEIAETLPFNLGNALKYCWRAGKKLDEVEDVKKAVFYLRRQANSKLALQKETHSGSIKKELIQDNAILINNFDQELARIVAIICLKGNAELLDLADELEIKYGLK